MLWMMSALLLIVWVLGWGFHIAGGTIHWLLAASLALALFNLESWRRQRGRAT